MAQRFSSWFPLRTTKTGYQLQKEEACDHMVLFWGAVPLITNSFQSGFHQKNPRGPPSCRQSLLPALECAVPKRSQAVKNPGGGCVTRVLPRLSGSRKRTNSFVRRLFASRFPGSSRRTSGPRSSREHCMKDGTPGPRDRGAVSGVGEASSVCTRK